MQAIRYSVCNSRHSRSDGFYSLHECVFINITNARFYRMPETITMQQGRLYGTKKTQITRCRNDPRLHDRKKVNLDWNKYSRYR
jgi:hypothetical protein